MTDVATTWTRPFERRLPPVVGLGMASLTLAVVGGIIVASQFGVEGASLVVPGVFVGGSLLLEVVAAVVLATIRPFAWDRFRQVFLIALAAYVVQAGIIEWTFIKNHAPAGPVTVLTGGLVVFATIVPLMIAFTTARYQALDGDEPSTS